MRSQPTQNDLIILVADRNMEFAVRGLLSRPQSLHIREVTYDIFTHIENDPGCLLHGHDFLRSYTQRYSYALVMLDHEGCGQEKDPCEVLESQIAERLAQVGREGRSAAIVLDPELEIWVWSDSPHVASILGWQGSQPDLRTWLQEQGLWVAGQAKPTRPKEAMEKALQSAGKPRSSQRYLELAQKVGLNRCQDSTFRRFRETLRHWFPAT